MPTGRHPLVSAAFMVAVALAAPKTCEGQGPAARADSANSPPAVPAGDAWYPEGFMRIRGKRYSIFVGASYTWFESGASRNRFGQGTWSPSFELYRPQHRGYSPLFELNGTSIASGDSSARVFAVSGGIRYRPVCADASRWLALAVGVAAGPRVVRISGWDRTTVAGVSAQIGLEILRTARVSARYDALPTVYGTRLSALSLDVAFRLPPYRRGNSRDDERDKSSAATCAGTGCAR